MLETDRPYSYPTLLGSDIIVMWFLVAVGFSVGTAFGFLLGSWMERGSQEDDFREVNEEPYS